MQNVQINTIIISLATLVLSACSKPEEAFIQVPAQVSAFELKASNVDLTEDLPGRVAALRTAEIRAQVGGIVQRRLFEQGAEIKAGQALFQINPAPFKAEVDIAAAALQSAETTRERARIQAERLRPLADAEAVSRQVYDDAVAQRDQTIAQVAQARATLARRQLDLKFATVDAPISGRIDQALVTEGALVTSSETNAMARIQQINQVYVDVRQPASSLETLREELTLQTSDGKDGLPSVILRNNGEAYPQPGKILFSGINVEVSTGDVLLRILVDNPQRLLLPGMFVRARVPRGSYTDALLVPQQAVVHNAAGTSVWVLDEKDSAHSTPVKVAELIAKQYRIREGLKAGQRIVVEGMDRLSDGAQVSARPWQVSSNTASAEQR